MNFEFLFLQRYVCGKMVLSKKLLKGRFKFFNDVKRQKMHIHNGNHLTLFVMIAQRLALLKCKRDGLYILSFFATL